MTTIESIKRAERSIRDRTLNFDSILEALQNDDLLGFCVDCGAERWNTESDAREYPCEDCGSPTVFGAGELLLMLVP